MLSLKGTLKWRRPIRRIEKAIAGLEISLIAVLTPLALFKTLPTHAMSNTAARDCDTNAVIRCGVYDNSELTSGYHSQGAAAIYSYFGITNQDINNNENDAVDGSVTRGGGVYANGRLVATNALTAGRQYIPGSARISSGGTTFYTRPPSVSFVSSPLAAYVVLNNGRFDYAILKSCGNPVIATPVAPPTKEHQPAPQPAPKPIPKPKPAPTPTPQASQSQSQSQSQAQNQSQTVNVYQQPSQQPQPAVKQQQSQSQAQAQNQSQASGTSQQQSQAQAQAQTQSTSATTTASAPAPQPQPQPAPQQPQPAAPQPSVQAATTLPNTGPGDLAGLAAIASGTAGLGHFIYRRRRR